MRGLLVDLHILKRGLKETPMTRLFPMALLTAWSLCSMSAQAAEPEEDFHLMNSESIGALKISMPATQVRKLIADQPSLGKTQEWAADGLFHQTWTYGALGLEIGMESDSRKSAQVIDRISVKAPSPLQTKRGIHVGSTEADVLKAYKADLSKDDSKPGEQVVAGSIYGGLIFGIKNGVVTDVFLGAAAE
jgi:hypothetical protein